jgi:hypothetical protein
MMDETVRQARRQARLTQSTEERRIAALEDISDSLMDIKDELMQLRIGLTVLPPDEVPVRPFRR